MTTTITFRHMKSSEAIKDFVNERLGKLDRFFGGAKEAHVILSVERYLQNAEVVLVATGIRVTGKASTSDLYASIDEAAEKVERALKKRHDKKVKTKTHAGRAEASL